MFIHIKVHPESKENKISRTSDTSFDVFVRTKAENHKANNDALMLVSAYTHIPLRKIRIVTGHHSPSKILELLDVQNV
jgi:uncharacterized protein YggU (UPF0235/DUF167 family)